MGARRTGVRPEGSLNVGCWRGYLVGLGIGRGDHHCTLFEHSQAVGNLVDQGKSTGCSPEVDVVRADHAPVLGTGMLDGLAIALSGLEDRSWTVASCTAVQKRATDAVLALATPARVRLAVQPVRHLRQLAVLSVLAEHSGSLHDSRADAMGYRFRPW